MMCMAMNSSWLDKILAVTALLAACLDTALTQSLPDESDAVSLKTRSTVSMHRRCSFVIAG